MCRHAPLPLDGPSYWTSLAGDTLAEEFTPVGSLAHHAEDIASEHRVQHWPDEWVVEVTPATDPQGVVFIGAPRSLTAFDACMCPYSPDAMEHHLCRLGLCVSVQSLENCKRRWPGLPQRYRHGSNPRRQMNQCCNAVAMLTKWPGSTDRPTS